MDYRVLVDAVYPEEVRIAVLSHKNNSLIDYDCEISIKKQLKGNIYLAKVSRVEPSLQAAFVEYEDGVHGFLPFSEIHLDYYQIPVADRKNVSTEAREVDEDSFDDDDSYEEDRGHKQKNNTRTSVAKTNGSQRVYQIQEVVKVGQLLLVQVAKEARGNKGVSLTTYVALVGRYSIFLPNSDNRTGGVSRRISDFEDRKRLKDYIKKLKINDGSSIILRTVAFGKEFRAIKTDYDHLLKLWDSIRNQTFVSEAPNLIYKESNVVGRIIREFDIENISEIIIDGSKVYESTYEFLKVIAGNLLDKIRKYRGKNPLFIKYGIEDKINHLFSRVVPLKSGGYLVIDVTEALIAIDINSGRSTREKNIEETAFKTNFEAVSEITKQLRLRDLSGIIVIDFIDMTSAQYRRKVEDSFKEHVKNDKAKIKVNQISSLGVLEVSRQRIRPNFFESHFEVCSHCEGSGVTRSASSMAINILRMIESKVIKDQLDKNSKTIVVYCHPKALTFLLNNKKSSLFSIEKFYNIKVRFEVNDNISSTIDQYSIKSDERVDVLDSLAKVSKVEYDRFFNENYVSSSRKNARLNNDMSVREKGDNLWLGFFKKFLGSKK